MGLVRGYTIYGRCVVYTRVSAVDIWHTVRWHCQLTVSVIL